MGASEGRQVQPYIRPDGQPKVAPRRAKRLQQALKGQPLCRSRGRLISSISVVEMSTVTLGRSRHRIFFPDPSFGEAPKMVWTSTEVLPGLGAASDVFYLVSRV